ncbi:hypothetical protein [Nocardia fluminea]|uniref:hypothetical protein n=1 Tax=Nocardia fluminea TaxID=134984 RepID=UPI003D1331EE
MDEIVAQPTDSECWCDGDGSAWSVIHCVVQLGEQPGLGTGADEGPQELTIAEDQQRRGRHDLVVAGGQWVLISVESANGERVRAFAGDLGQRRRSQNSGSS